MAVDAGDYRLSENADPVFNTAAALGVTDDLLGVARDLAGEVTFGAVETGE